MTDLDALRRTLNNYTAQIDSTAAKIRDLNDKIDALKKALKESEHAHTAFEKLATNVAKISVLTV